MSDPRLEFKCREQKSVDSDSENKIYRIEFGEEELRCPISLQIWYDPVIVNSCGHSTFEREKIASLNQCPLCRKSIISLIPDRRVQDIISKLIAKNPQLTNECYFSIRYLTKVLSGNTVFPELLIKILRHSKHLNEISDVKGYKGSSALTELTAYPNGLELLTKDSAIQENITSEGLNAILTEGDYAGTSALYWLCANNSILLKTLSDKITTEALNYPRALGKHQGYSPLYWLCHNSDDLEMLSENSELRSKISIEGLNNCVQSGTSPVYHLCGWPTGRQLLMKDEKLRNKISSAALNQLVISEDKNIANDSALYQLFCWDIDLLLKDPILRSKITPETLNSIYKEQTLNYHYPTLLLLTQNSKGLKLLIQDNALTEKITEKGLNHITHDGTSVLYKLTNSYEGIELLIKNPKLCEKISPAALKREFKNPLLNLVKSMLGRELLFKNKSLREKIISSPYTLSMEGDSTHIPIRILSETELGKKILRQLFNTPAQIGRLSLYSVLTENTSDLINILTPAFIRSVVDDKEKIIQLADAVRDNDALVFLNEVYNFNISLDEYLQRDNPESTFFQTLELKLVKFKKDLKSSAIDSDQTNSSLPIFDEQNEKALRSGSLSYVHLSIFSFLNDKELSVAARVSKQFKKLAEISQKSQSLEFLICR